MCIQLLPHARRPSLAAVQERGGETVMGAVSLECSPAAGPTKFMIGTEQGPILSCNRKAKTPQDRVTGTYPGVATSAASRST